MSTAQNTKSTFAATAATSAASITTIFFFFPGIGVGMAHRAPTASSYVFPAERGEAANAARRNHG